MVKALIETSGSFWTFLDAIDIWKGGLELYDVIRIWDDSAAGPPDAARGDRLLD